MAAPAAAAAPAVPAAAPAARAALGRAGPDAEETLRSFLERKDLRELEPWRINVERFRIMEKAAHAFTIDDMKRKFIARVKAGLMTPNDVLECASRLAGDDGDQTFYSYCLIHLSPRERITAHNWRVATMLGDLFLMRYGSHIESFTYPLLPCFPELEEMQAKLLEEMMAPAPRGAGAPSRLPSIFKKPDDLTGAGYVAPISDGPGCIDLSELNHHVTALEHHVSSMHAQQKRGGGGGGRGRGGQRGGRGGQQMQQHQQQHGARRQQQRGPRGGDDSAVRSKPEEITTDEQDF